MEKGKQQSKPTAPATPVIPTAASWKHYIPEGIRTMKFSSLGTSCVNTWNQARTGVKNIYQRIDAYYSQNGTIRDIVYPFTFVIGGMAASFFIYHRGYTKPMDKTIDRQQTQISTLETEIKYIKENPEGLAIQFKKEKDATQKRYEDLSDRFDRMNNEYGQSTQLVRNLEGSLSSLEAERAKLTSAIEQSRKEFELMKEEAGKSGANYEERLKQYEAKQQEYQAKLQESEAKQKTLQEDRDKTNQLIQLLNKNLEQFLKSK